MHQVKHLYSFTVNTLSNQNVKTSLDLKCLNDLTFSRFRPGRYGELLECYRSIVIYNGCLGNCMFLNIFGCRFFKSELDNASLH